MSLYSISIRRPVLAVVMSITIVLFGLLCFFDLGVREYPAVDPPIITVATNYRGANADVIESQITEPLERAVAIKAEEQRGTLPQVLDVASLNRRNKVTA